MQLLRRQGSKLCIIRLQQVSLELNYVSCDNRGNDMVGTKHLSIMYLVKYISFMFLNETR